MAVTSRRRQRGGSALARRQRRSQALSRARPQAHRVPRARESLAGSRREHGGSACGPPYGGVLAIASFSASAGPSDSRRWAVPIAGTWVTRKRAKREARPTPGPDPIRSTSLAASRFETEKRLVST